MSLQSGGTGQQQPMHVSPMIGEANPVSGVGGSLPKYRLPDGPMVPGTAYQLIHDELMLDGNSRLNLATFVTTWMEPQAEQLMAGTWPGGSSRPCSAQKMSRASITETGERLPLERAFQ
jgi:glutamate decarboxylase